MIDWVTQKVIKAMSVTFDGNITPLLGGETPMEESEIFFSFSFLAGAQDVTVEDNTEECREAQAVAGITREVQPLR